MPDIKLKEENKGIKAIDKAATLSERMKSGVIKTKEKAENGYYQDAVHDTPEECATDDAEHKTETVVRNTAYMTKRTVKKGTKRIVRKIKENRAKKQMPKPESTELSVRPTSSTVQSRSITNTPRLQSASSTANRSIKTTSRAIKQTGKGTIKTAQKSVKTAEKTSKAAIKTTQQAAKAAQKTAQASVKAAQRAAQAARATAKAAVATAKAVAKAVAAAVKAIIAGTKALIAAIAAGGWVAVVVIIVICLVALIVGSCFGIFFSNEDTNSGGTPMTQVVAQLNTEYYDKIEQAKTAANADEVEIISSDGLQAIRWNEVLAVYAVKSTTGDNPTDVITITDEKIEMLRTVLWDMNAVTHTTRSVTKTVTVTETDAEGNEITAEKSITETVLTVNLTHKSYTDMIAVYGFNADQTEQLNVMMSSEYDSMWAELLGGYSAGTGEIIISNSEHIPTDIFSWPLPEGYTISSPFGYRADPFTGKTKFHGGLDIAAPAGTPILAATDGTVEVANATDSWGYGYGYHVKIRHNDTDGTLYAHCSSIAVVNGQKVKKGQVIAYVGTTGNSTGNHLHFEVYKNGERTNPLDYFR